MSGVGFWELVVLFVIGLMILGPERLPRVASQIGRWIGKARRTANQLRYQLEREVALADIEEKKQSRRQQEEATRRAAPSSGTATGPAQNSDAENVEPAAAAGTEPESPGTGPAPSGAGAAAPESEPAKREA